MALAATSLSVGPARRCLPASSAPRPWGARDRAGGPCPPASSGPPRKRKRVCSCPQPPSCPQASLRPGTGLLSRVLGGSRQLGPSDLPSRPLRQFFGFCACTCAGGRPLCPGCPLPVSQAWPAASAPGAPVHMALTAISAARGSRARRVWPRSCPRGTAGSAGGPASPGDSGQAGGESEEQLAPPACPPPLRRARGRGRRGAPGQPVLSGPRVPVCSMRGLRGRHPLLTQRPELTPSPAT